MSNPPLTEVKCPLTDCLYHQVNPKPSKPELIALCAHAHKPLHLLDQPCPLYRLDWQKKAAQGQQLTKKMFGRR